MTTTPTRWGNEATVSNFFTDFDPHVVGLKDGTFDIVWQRDGGDLVGRHLNEQGGFTPGGDFLQPLSAFTSNAMSSPQVIELANGRTVVMFDQQYQPGDIDIRYHYANEGNGLNSPLETTGANEFLLDSTALPNGGFAYAFQFEDNHGAANIALRFVDPTGSSASGRVIIATQSVGQTQQNPAIEALHSGAVAVAYEVVNTSTGAREIRLQVREADGDFTTGVWQASALDKNAAFPEIVELANGNFVVAWQQDGGLAFREFGTDLTPIESTATPVTDSAGGFLPKMTALHDGGFMMAWTSRDGTEGDGSAELDIFAQRFDRNGNIVGNQIHIDKPGDQGFGNFDMTTLEDGRVIMTYGSETGDATNVNNLNYQIFDPRDANITATNGTDNYVSRIDGATISGLNGNDKLTGMGAVDTLFGGNGDDQLGGNGGNDRLEGGAGTDFVEGGSGNDLLYGGANSDNLYGGDGNDRSRGRRRPRRDGRRQRCRPVLVRRRRHRPGRRPAATSSTASRMPGRQAERRPDRRQPERSPATRTSSSRATAAFTGIGQVRFVSSGTDRILQFNNDSDLQADFEIVLEGFDDQRARSATSPSLKSAWQAAESYRQREPGTKRFPGASTMGLILGTDSNDMLTGTDVSDRDPRHGRQRHPLRWQRVDGIYGGNDDDRVYGGDGADLIYGDESSVDAPGTGNDVLYGGAGGDELHGGAGRRPS